MKPRIAIVLLFVAFLLALFTPAEERLGNSYKLIYVHLPLSIISFTSLFLFPFLTYFDLRPGNFAIATLIFIIVNLILSAVFMWAAWGGISISEPRVIFNIFLILLVIFFVVSLTISKHIALLYSVIQPLLAYWVYQSISKVPFQLHPVSLVEMDIIMRLPFFFTFPAFAIIYYSLGISSRDSPSG
ncbi:MAG TPA: hypothetical protein EYP30_01565 [Archaeoglobaceae archaeon]|nr:hypothetical protein [Archaeoglobaceae archaeon]